MDAIQYMTSTIFRRELVRFRVAEARFEETGKVPNRILSFGCSIGDEVATLQAVFPNAQVVGADVDEAALAAAERSVGHFATIVKSDVQKLKALGPFDLISACSVLCLNPKPKDFTERFPFSRFEELIGILDDLLAPGGLLVLTNASYRFQHTAAFQRYDVVRSDMIPTAGFVSIMAPDGQEWLKSGTAPSSYFYLKGPAFDLVDDEGLADSLFEKRGAGDPAIHWTNLCPPPADFHAKFIFSRQTTDGLATPVPENAIVETIVYEVGATEDGRQGLVYHHAWPSVTGEGVHHRPRIWSETGPRAFKHMEVGQPFR